MENYCTRMQLSMLVVGDAAAAAGWQGQTPNVSNFILVAVGGKFSYPTPRGFHLESCSAR